MSTRILFLLLLLVIELTIFAACTKSRENNIYSKEQIDSLSQTFSEYVAAKNEEFKTADWSPLTAEDKINFKGLKYYPYDVSYRFHGTIEIYKQADSITIRGTRKGDLRSALKYGYFQFEKEGREQRLEIIKILPKQESGQAHLFLGFWDATSGTGTYPGGRYIDLQENDQNDYTIDFNYAYNPYCAYSDRYSCAIPPLENRLTIALNCGEKIFREH